jgi:hypothetical protein
MSPKLAAALSLGIVAPVLVAAWITSSARPEAPAPKDPAPPRQWAYVERTQDLSPTESLSLVIVAHPRWTALDTRCLIYRDKQLGTVTFTCPGSAVTDAVEERER